MSTSVIQREAAGTGVILSEAAKGSGAEGSDLKSPTYASLLADAIRRLEAAGVPDAKWDAQELLSWAGGPDRTHLPLLGNAVPSEKVKARFAEGMALRGKRVPLQQIIGTAWFMGLPFEVNEDVLCPRADTEVLTELAIRRMEEAQTPAPRILDLCCGSGCIGISLARYLPEAIVWLSDISPKALKLARRNAERNNVSGRCRLAEGDLLDALTEEGISLKEMLQNASFSLICCNPPYIPAQEIGELMPEVRDHEPRLALDGGTDGLDLYRRLAEELSSLYQNKAEQKTDEERHLPFFLLEIGCEQGQAVKNIFESAGAGRVILHKDLAGLDRVAEIVPKGTVPFDTMERK